MKQTMLIPTSHKARRSWGCGWCNERIIVGEVYITFLPPRSKYHPECGDEITRRTAEAPYGHFVFCRGHDRPKGASSENQEG